MAWERKPDTYRHKWKLEPDGPPECGGGRACKVEWFAYEDLAGLRAAYWRHWDAGLNPQVSWYTVVTPGNGRSQRRHASWVHITRVGQDIDALPSSERNVPPEGWDGGRD